MELSIGEDGLPRCWWGAEPEIYRRYHDEEWGRPMVDNHRLFEKICLEGFQSGLSWLTVLRKRENFRQAFSGFEPSIVSRYDDTDVERLLGDEGIIRHRGKIRSAINNAVRAVEMIEEYGSLASFFWRWAEPDDTPAVLESATPVSTALSGELKRRGWSFVGPTTAYAFMQATGLVNDHLAGCHVREACSRERGRTLSRFRPQ